MVTKPEKFVDESLSEGALGPENEIRFVILGKPVPKARPRFSGENGNVYTPKATKTKEMAIGLVYRARYHGFRFEGGVPLRMVVDEFYPIPKSKPKSVREAMIAGEIRPTTKPDVENVGKLVMDALNGVAYHDDSQIVELVCRKMYSAQPRLEVYIARVTDEK